MSQIDQEIVVKADELREFACTLYRKAGGQPGTCGIDGGGSRLKRICGGVYSHGTRHAPSYIEQILSGGLNPDPEIRALPGGRQLCAL